MKDNISTLTQDFKRPNLKAIAITGSGGRLADITDIIISVPSTSTQHIQESHITIDHISCDLIECCLFDDKQVVR